MAASKPYHKMETGSKDILSLLPSRAMTRRAFLGIGGFTLLAGAATAGTVFTEPHWIDRTRVRFPVRGLPKEFVGYRIGQISDIHYPRNMSREFVRDAMTALNSMNPDVIVVTGDIVDRRGSVSMPNLSGFFDHCTPPDGMLAVLGNHDHDFGVGTVRAEFEANTPLRLIDHTHVLIERGEARIAIGGVGDLWKDVVDLPRTFAGLSDSIPRILLSHNPDVVELAADKGVRVDLQLSGHTHGGEVCLPFYGPPITVSRFGKKYNMGLVKGPRWPVYVNRGICSPRFVRFLCRPEVTCIELVAA